jgi:hypothetical protein
MGIARPKHLPDLLRLKAHLRVTCPRCDRTGLFPVQDVIAYFRSRGWNLAWDTAGSRFRCEACGRRGARLSIAQADEPPRAPLPEPTIRDHKIRLRRERS